MQRRRAEQLGRRMRAR